LEYNGAKFLKVYIVKEIEWEWQEFGPVCATEEIAIRERDKKRAQVPLDDPHYQEKIDCLQYEEFEVLKE
jgi:hypothetical protein